MGMPTAVGSGIGGICGICGGIRGMRGCSAAATRFVARVLCCLFCFKVAGTEAAT